MGDVPKKREGLRLLMLNLFYWASAGAYSPFLSAYFTSRGVSGFGTGILMAIGPVAAILIQPLWAVVSDRTGRPRLILMLVTVGAAGSSLLYYTGSRFSTLFLSAACFSAFFQALLPLCDAIVLQRAAQGGLDFAKIRLGGTLGYAAVVFGTGFYLDRHPSAQFALTFGILALLLLFELQLPKSLDKKAPERAPAEETAPREEPAPGPPRRGAVFTTREAYFVLAFAFIIQLGLGFSGSFLGVYVVELGYSASLIGILSCISALSEVPILLFARRILRRLGAVPILAASGVLMSLRIFLTGVGLIPAFVAAQLLQSVTYMTAYLCCTTYISGHVHPGRASQGQSILAVVQTGLAAVTANLAGGFAAQWLGTQTAYYAAACAIFVSSVLVMLAHRVYLKRSAVPVS